MWHALYRPYIITLNREEILPLTWCITFYKQTFTCRGIRVFLNLLKNRHALSLIHINKKEGMWASLLRIISQQGSHSLFYLSLFTIGSFYIQVIMYNYENRLALIL